MNLCDSGDASKFIECQDSSTTTNSTITRPEIDTAALQGDLVTDDGKSQFPANQLTITASNVGRTGVLVNVNANPNSPEDVPDGDYIGSVVVERGDGTSALLKVNANLTPRTGSVVWITLLALGLGAAGGTLLKWLNDSFSPLAALRRRQRRVQSFLRDSRGALPVGVEARLQQIRDEIKDFDDDSSISATIDTITGNQDTLVAFARDVKFIHEQLVHQIQSYTRQMPSEVGAAIQTHVFELQRFLDDVWPWQEASETRRRLAECRQKSCQLSLEMDRYSRSGDATMLSETARSIIASGRNAGIVIEDKAKEFSKSIKPISAASVSGEVGAAADDAVGAGSVLVLAVPAVKDVAVAPAAPNATPAAAEGMVLPDLSAVSPSRLSVGEWLLDSAWWLTLIVVSCVVVFVGYQTQFVDNIGFQGDTADYIQMAAWALAIQVAGGTVIETVGRLRTTR